MKGEREGEILRTRRGEEKAVMIIYDMDAERGPFRDQQVGGGEVMGGRGKVIEEEENKIY